MVWGGIIGDRNTELVRVDGRLTGERYAKDILTFYVLTICGNCNSFLMHDNAPPHTADIEKALLEREGVKTMQ